MSRHTFSSISGYRAPELEIHEAGASATGRHDQPIVIIPITFHAWYPFEGGGLGLDIQQLSCKVSPFDEMYITASRPVVLDMIVTGRNRDGLTRQNSLELPFDQARLEQIERTRKGGDVRLRLDFELCVDELVEIPNLIHSGMIAWAFRQHHRLSLWAEIVIPRSSWVDRVLPLAGYGKVLMIELPRVPLESCKEVQKSFDALTQAQEMYKLGLFDDAVGKCRLALEPFFKVIDETGPDKTVKKITVLDPSWETKLGKATYQWLCASFVAVKTPTNKPHHSTSAGFDRLDAQLLMAVTTALVAYVIQTSSGESTM